MASPETLPPDGVSMRIGPTCHEPPSHGVLPGLCGSALLALLVAGCGESALDKVRQRGELVVLTRNAPTTYYIGPNGTEGPEYDLTQAFGEWLGVEVHYRIRHSIAQILAGIESGDADIAAAGLTRTEAREERFRFGPGYKTIQQQVVCHREGPVPDDIDELAEVSLQIIAHSSYQERLQELKSDYPELEWDSTDELATEQILERVAGREIDCAVADSNIVAINRRFFPQLAVAFPITEEQTLAWVLPPSAPSLERVLERWFDRKRTQQLLEHVDERYYGHVEVFDYVDLSRFRRRIHSRLPRYEDGFRTAGQKYGLSWTLLAAQAYQESHWDPKSESRTGVRGMMMLTQRTARELGVRNRLDPGQSIMGGARYLARLRERIPEEIPGEERIWFALAAYNVGFGHLRDARRLATELGKNPNRWNDIREVLPLLAKRRYYKNLTYGYARGSEPVRYVQRVRDYRDILEQQLASPEEASSPARGAETPS